MKRILFIIGALDSGGVAKSIVNLLNAIDRKERVVHLLMMHDVNGPYQKYLPEDVQIHCIAEAGWLLEGWCGIVQLIRHGHLLLALGSMLRMSLSFIDKPLAGWLLSRLFPALSGDWDVIIDYNGQQQLYYMVDKLKGKRKITFFHSDYHKWPYYERMDRQYFPKVDAICTISEQCARSLKEVFPEVANKVKLVPNISLPKMIYKLADEPLEMPPLHGAVFATIGHVCYNKGIDLIIGAAKILKEKEYDFSWILVGSTNDAVDYINEINQYSLKDNIYMVGVQSNPYVYMNRADIIVHPSRFEGKSITLDEAKILCKPVVVTNFSTVNDQFEDGVNASICEMECMSLAIAIETLLKKSELQSLYKCNLQHYEPEVNAVLTSIEKLLEESI